MAQLQQQLATALQRIAELEQHRVPPPPFVKAKRAQPSAPKRPRKKRAAQHNHARPRDTPTHIEHHMLERCPTCGYRLRGNSLAYTRQVIEVPRPQPVEIIEHHVIKRWCPCCTRWRTPRLDLSQQILGQGRIGIRIASLIAYLRTSLRLPVRSIQTYLHSLHQLSLSIGTIVHVLHQVRHTTQSVVAAIKAQARASPVLHSDETGWRENGQNGYIWSFSTPGAEGVRYYEYDPSRGQQVVRRILGYQFRGHLASDFYGSYNVYGGKHQRCWVHLLRDLHSLKEGHADNSAVLEWAQAVRGLYDDARRWLQVTTRPPRHARDGQYVRLVGRTHDLGVQYAAVKGHPCQALAKRLLRHEDELFQFVLVEGLSADNNLAERSIRPLVIVRKISGGSRSPDGTQTRMALATLFETWQARRLNPFEECLKVLHQTPFPQL